MESKYKYFSFGGGVFLVVNEWVDVLVCLVIYYGFLDSFVSVVSSFFWNFFYCVCDFNWSIFV